MAIVSGSVRTAFIRVLRIRRSVIIPLAGNIRTPAVCVIRIYRSAITLIAEICHAAVFRTLRIFIFPRISAFTGISILAEILNLSGILILPVPAGFVFAAIVKRIIRIAAEDFFAFLRSAERCVGIGRDRLRFIGIGAVNRGAVRRKQRVFVRTSVAQHQQQPNLSNSERAAVAQQNFAHRRMLCDIKLRTRMTANAQPVLRQLKIRVAAAHRRVANRQIRAARRADQPFSNHRIAHSAADFPVAFDYDQLADDARHRRKLSQPRGAAAVDQSAPARAQHDQKHHSGKEIAHRQRDQFIGVLAHPRFLLPINFHPDYTLIGTKMQSFARIRLFFTTIARKCPFWDANGRAKSVIIYETYRYKKTFRSEGCAWSLPERCI